MPSKVLDRSLEAKAVDSTLLPSSLHVNGQDYTTNNVYSVHLRAYGVTGFYLLHCEV